MFCEKDIFRNLQNRKIHQINFIKKATLAQMFSYDFWEIFMNSFFYSTPSVTPMYNQPSVYVTDRPFVNVVHYQYAAHSLVSLSELKLGLHSVYLLY